MDARQLVLEVGVFLEEAVELGAVVEEDTVRVVLLRVAVGVGRRQRRGFLGGLGWRGVVLVVGAVAGDGAAGGFISQRVRRFGG